MDQEGGTGGSDTPPPPLLARIPKKSQIYQLSHREHASETPFAGGPRMAHLFGFYLHSSTKTQQQKNPVKVGPPLTQLSVSSHDFCVKSFEFWCVSVILEVAIEIQVSNL